MARHEGKGCFLWLLFLVMVLAAGGGYYWFVIRGNSEKASLGELAPRLENPAGAIERSALQTTLPKQVEVPLAVRVSGSLIADEESEVAARISGVVDKVLVDRGDTVDLGSDLVLLDDTNAVLALDQAKAQAAELMVRLGLRKSDENFSLENQPDVKSAKAQLELARSNFSRDQELLTQKVIAPSEFDESRNALATAEQRYELSLATANQLFQSYQTALQRVKQSAQQVDDTHIRAPFDAYVVERNTAPGEYLQQGSPAIRIVRVDPLRLELTVPEQDAALIAEDQPVRFSIAAYPDREFEGIVKRVVPAISSEDRSLIVEALVDNPDRELKPGYFVQAEVLRKETKTVTRVPRSAVRVRQDVARVYAIEGDTIRERVVNLDELDTEHADITNGLKADERIITDVSQVEDGMSVIDEMTTGVAMKTAR